MKHFNISIKPMVIAAITGMLTAGPVSAKDKGYEVWGADQSNSLSGVASRGVSGSYLWIWDSKDVEKQLSGKKDAKPLGCNGKNKAGDGPCNLYDVFPSNLVEHDGSGATGNTLSDLPGFGRLHGMIADPQNRYMNVNMFAPGGGYVGIVDGDSKAAVALFRVTGTNAGQPFR